MISNLVIAYLAMAVLFAAWCYVESGADDMPLGHQFLAGFRCGALGMLWPVLFVVVAVAAVVDRLRAIRPKLRDPAAEWTAYRRRSFCWCGLPKMRRSEHCPGHSTSEELERARASFEVEEATHPTHGGSDAEE